MYSICTLLNDTVYSICILWWYCVFTTHWSIRLDINMLVNEFMNKCNTICGVFCLFLYSVVMNFSDNKVVISFFFKVKYVWQMKSVRFEWRRQQPIKTLPLGFNVNKPVYNKQEKNCVLFTKKQSRRCGWFTHGAVVLIGASLNEHFIYIFFIHL